MVTLLRTLRGASFVKAVVKVMRLPGWQKLMLVGFFLWLVISLRAPLGLGAAHGLLSLGGLVSLLKLLTGLFILQGACEALMQSVERLGARLRWNGYVAGTLGEILSTLPELVFITLVVRVEPLGLSSSRSRPFITTRCFSASIRSSCQKTRRGNLSCPPQSLRRGQMS